MAETYPPIPEQPAAAPGAAPSRGMSTTTKVILGLLAVLGLCCVACGVLVVAAPTLLTPFLEGSVVDDPAEARSMGQSIVSYDLPAGYEESSAINLMGIMEMVFIAENGMDTDQNMIILLARFSIPGITESDAEQMKEQMQQQMASGRSSGGIRFVEIDSRPITINGEPTTLTIAEGESEGELYRQEVAAFSSEGKPAMVMLMGPADSWDTTAAEQFIQSLE